MPTEDGKQFCQKPIYNILIYNGVKQMRIKTSLVFCPMLPSAIFALKHQKYFRRIRRNSTCSDATEERLKVSWAPRVM